MVFRRRARSARSKRGGAAHVVYSRWDGSQKGFDLDADTLLSQMLDDLVYDGDPNSALRRMLLEGFEDRNGRDVQGIRELLDRLRQERQQRLERFDLGGVYDEIADELRQVVDQERETLDRLAEQARADEDRRRGEVGEQAAAERQLQLDMLPEDLAGKVRGLQEYDFRSAEAQQRFEELLDRLRQQLMQQMVDQMSGAMQDMTPQDMSRMKDMLSELNQMLEQRARGEEPDFDGFMDRFGDFFPENPQSLDELLEIMAQRMAAMQQMLNSMTPEQRAQLQQLSDQLLEDMDLRWQMDQLGQNLRQMLPQMGWDRSFDFSGADPLDMSQAMQMMEELGDLDALERMLRQTTNPGALAEVDIDRVRELLDDDAAESLERMSELARMLEEAGLIENREGRFELTPRAIRRIGQQVLGDLFRKLNQDRVGRHAIDRAGIGHEREVDTKPYEFGDPFNLHIERTVRNAIRRTGGGTPVQLTPEDFEVERTEQLVRSSTVLMLDLSLSMPMRDNFLPAKKVAMALHALISSQYPRDYLGIVTFSEVAREIKPERLPEVSWDYVYGTNMQHGFMLARRMLGRQTGTKQIIMITDGEPTAHITPSGRPYFSYPPSYETVELTMKEVAKCTRDGIRINTFMLDATNHLTTFIEKITRMNGGRAFFTTNQNLGDYVLVDFVEQKRAMRRGSRAG
jgi:uncharacterized protein with von Willebrand factor type A (vWA) domain